MSNPSSQQATSQAPAQKVKVSIKKIAHSSGKEGAPASYEIKSSHELPPASVVIKFVPPKLKSALDNLYRPESYPIPYLIGYSAGKINLKRWGDIIAAATAEMLRPAHNSADSELIVGREPAYLAVGHTIYEMRAIDHTNTSRAMPALRRAIIEQSRQECDAIRAAAHSQASKIHSEADAYRAKVQAEAAIVEHDHAQLVRELAQFPPQWLRSCPLSFPPDNGIFGSHTRKSPLICYLNGTLNIEITFNLNITEFVYLDKKWKAVPADPTPVHLWLPLDDSTGSYRISAIWCDPMLNGGGFLPHASDYYCLGSGEVLPERINSYQAYQSIVSIIARISSQVNLASLLVSPANWCPAVLRFVPPYLAKLWANLRYDDSVHSILSSAVADPPEPSPLSFEVPPTQVDPEDAPADQAATQDATFDV